MDLRAALNPDGGPLFAAAHLGLTMLGFMSQVRLPFQQGGRKLNPLLRLLLAPFDRIERGLRALSLNSIRSAV